MPISDEGKPGRFDVREPVARGELEAIATNPKTTLLQAGGPLTEQTWRRIEELIVVPRPEIAVRVYGHYSEVCDLSFLRHLPSLRRFSADCLHGEVLGIEHVSSLARLESLTIGVWRLESLDVLSAVPANLRVLRVAASKSRRLDLSALRRFRDLEELLIEGHQKNIETLSELHHLKKISLRSISTPDVGYIAPLNELREVWIGLGGIRDLSAMHGKASVRRLEVWQVRGFHDAGVLVELPGLRDALLQSLPQVRSLPDLRTAGALRRLVLINMKGLNDFGPVEFAPALETFALFDVKHVAPEALAPVLRSRSLKHASAGLGSVSRNKAFEALRDAAGMAPAAEYWSLVVPEAKGS